MNYTGAHSRAGNYDRSPIEIIRKIELVFAKATAGYILEPLPTLALISYAKAWAEGNAPMTSAVAAAAIQDAQFLPDIAQTDAPAQIKSRACVRAPNSQNALESVMSHR